MKTGMRIRKPQWTRRFATGKSCFALVISIALSAAGARQPCIENLKHPLE
ncbi:MAG: hypothetical protein IJR99_04760 [Kiritimatiellae bacterium]|nr:hypothetical protein [Kiritimatiellia bacterium]